SNEVR
ncbi:putative ribosomal RNA large subunit methyltransferase I, partial [Vibrio parahaemolyticus EKP-008]